MSQRILRTIPMAVLMTTAMAWNLPAAAQGTASTPPPAASAGPAQSTPPQTSALALQPAPKAPAGTSATDGDRLPADLTPAMPASTPDKSESADTSSDRDASKPTTPKP